MSIAGLEQKVLISVKVEAAQARDSMKKLAEDVGKVEKEVKKLNFKQALGAAGQAFNLLDQKLKITDSELGKVVGSAIQFAKVGGQIAGPWGAAAGAVVGALSEIDGGLDDINESVKRYSDSLKTADQRIAESIKGLSSLGGQLKAIVESAHSMSDAVKLVTAHLGHLHAATATFESVGPVLKAVNDQLDAQKKILGDLNDPRTKFTLEQSALNMLLENGAISVGDYMRKQAELVKGIVAHEGIVAKTAKAYRDLYQAQRLALDSALGTAPPDSMSEPYKGYGLDSAKRAEAIRDDIELEDELAKVKASEKGSGLSISSALVPDDMSALQGVVATQEKIQVANINTAASNWMLGESYAALGSAAASVYSDLIDGNISLGAAVKRAAGDALKSLGLRFLVEGAGEVAKGVQMAAGIYTAWMAPGHFAAAGKYFAAAGIAGVASAALGGGGSSGGGGGGSGGGRAPSAPSSYSAPSGHYSGGSNVTIVYGDQFADDSPRNRQRTAQKLLAHALGTSGGTYS